MTAKSKKCSFPWRLTRWHPTSLMSVTVGTYIVILIIFSSSICIHAQSCDIKQYSMEDGLPSNHITNLQFDDNNRLWLSTAAGLAIFNGIRIIPTSSNIDVGRIIHMQFHKGDKLIVLNDQSHIYQFDIHNFEGKLYGTVNHNLDAFEKIRVTLLDSISLFMHDTYPFLSYGPSKISNLKKWVDYKFGIEFTINQKNKDEGLTVSSEKLMLINAEKKYWVYMNKLTPHIIKSELPEDMYYSGLLFDDNTNSYFLYNNSIYKINIIDDKLVLEKILDGVPLDKIENNLTTGTYNEKTGTFYFSSTIDGLYEVKKYIFNGLVHDKDLLSSRNPRFLSSYYSQALMADGKILINNYLILDSGEFTGFKETKHPYILAFNYVDLNNRLWFLDKEKLFVVNSDKKKKIIKGFNLDKNILSISPGRDPDSYYFIHRASLGKIVRDEVAAFESLTTLGISPDSEAQFIYKTVNNEYFILTSKYIYQINPEAKTSQRIKNLPEVSFRHMCMLKPDLYFVGSYGNGFFLYDGKNWTSIPMDSKGHLKFAHVALCDDNGHVWISTNNGLFRTRLVDLENYIYGKTDDVFYYYYDKSDGFLTNEFNGQGQSPAIQLHDGRMSFSALKGLVQFDPLSVPALFPDSLLNIMSVTLNDMVLDKVPHILSLTQDIKDILIELGTVYYGHPQNLILEYRLSGSEEKWKALDQKRYIHLQNLSYGDYTIQIRKRIGFGQDDFQYLTYTITVLPYFYQTFWFYALVLTCLLISIFLGFRWYNRFTLKRNLALERLIHEQKQDLVEFNNDLKEKIKQNDLFQSIFVHDIKSPLRFIESNSDLLLKNRHRIDLDVVFGHLHHIQEASSKIKRFVDETVLWMNIRNGEFDFHKEPFLICALFDKVRNFHVEDEKIIKGDLVIHIQCEKDFLVYSDPVFIETLLRNLLSNSLKHTQGGDITLYAQKWDNNSFRIGCRDTGAGMTPEIVDRLLSPDYNGNTIRHDSFRLGYVIIKELIRILEGQLYIQSHLDQGTDVYIDF